MKAVALAVVTGAVVASLAIAGCGGKARMPSVPGAGKGIGYGLSAAGLQFCAGPVPGQAVPATYSGQPVGVTLNLYAQHGFAALVGSGAGAKEHAIELIELRNHVGSFVSPGDVAGVERAWRRQASKALSSPTVPRGPCRSEAPALPVLAPTEIICQDELFIPLGRSSATDLLNRVMSTLEQYNPGHLVRHYLSGGSYYFTTTPGHESTPYCRSQ